MYIQNHFHVCHLPRFRIHYCTSCGEHSHWRPEINLAHTGHCRYNVCILLNVYAQYLMVCISSIRSRFSHSKKMKFALLPNDQQGEPFLPDSL